MSWLFSEQDFRPLEEHRENLLDASFGDDEGSDDEQRDRFEERDPRLLGETDE